MDTKKIIYRFLDGLGDKVEISRQDLQVLFDGGISVESFLDTLVSDFDFLLHGSVFSIDPGQELAVGRGGKLFSTNTASVAILKAVFSNQLVNLQYPMKISHGSPMRLIIQGERFLDACIGQGYVYVVSSEGFENSPTGTWQYVSSRNKPFVRKVSVLRSDFVYPVE